VTNAKAGVNTANTIMWQLRSVTGEGTIFLRELALSVKTAPTTGPSWRLNRPTAVGTSSATVTPLAEASGLVTAAQARLDTAWSANPTLAGTDLREYATPNAIGSGIVWTWPDKPFEIGLGATAGGLAVVNGNATSTTLGLFVIYAVYDV
jgi:hypothetical protein